MGAQLVPLLIHGQLGPGVVVVHRVGVVVERGGVRILLLPVHLVRDVVLNHHRLHLRVAVLQMESRQWGNLVSNINEFFFWISWRR